MHLLESEHHPRLRHALRRGITFKDRVRAFVMWVANRIANFRKFSSGPRVTLTKLEEGGVKLVLSVLYVPFDEMDLGRPYGSPPQPGYAAELEEQMQLVEDDLEREDPQFKRHLIVK